MALLEKCMPSLGLVKGLGRMPVEIDTGGWGGDDR